MCSWHPRAGRSTGATPSSVPTTSRARASTNGAAEPLGLTTYARRHDREQLGRIRTPFCEVHPYPANGGVDRLANLCCDGGVATTAWAFRDSVSCRLLPKG